MAEMTVPEARSPESSEDERCVSRVDALLERVGLLLRETAVLDSLIDAVLERLLERVRELARLDAELLRGVVDNRLALLLRGPRLGCGDSRSSSGDGECDDRTCGDLDLRASVQFVFSSVELESPPQTYLTSGA